MLTLMDIDRLTYSRDGSVYSDLYKDVYGVRPRGITFESMEEFDRSYQQLVVALDRELEREKEEEEVNFRLFEKRVAEVFEQVQNCTSRAHAVKIIADAEGIREDYLQFYGFDVLEYELGLKFGSIKAWMENPQA